MRFTFLNIQCLLLLLLLYIFFPARWYFSAHSVYNIRLLLLYVGIFFFRFFCVWRCTHEWIRIAISDSNKHNTQYPNHLPLYIISISDFRVLWEMLGFYSKHILHVYVSISIRLIILTCHTFFFRIKLKVERNIRKK